MTIKIIPFPIVWIIYLRKSQGIHWKSVHYKKPHLPHKIPKMKSLMLCAKILFLPSNTKRPLISLVGKTTKIDKLQYWWQIPTSFTTLLNFSQWLASSMSSIWLTDSVSVQYSTSSRPRIYNRQPGCIQDKKKIMWIYYTEIILIDPNFLDVKEKNLEL